MQDWLSNTSSPTAESRKSAHGIEALGGGQGKAQREGHLLNGSTGPESSCQGRFPLTGPDGTEVTRLERTVCNGDLESRSDSGSLPTFFLSLPLFSLPFFCGVIFKCTKV